MGLRVATSEDGSYQQALRCETNAFSKMRFTHKDWNVELSGNNIAYWPIASPEEKHTLQHTGGNYSLIKAYLDAVEMKLEEEEDLLKQVKQAISDALESSKFTEQEKQFLMAEQMRLKAAIQASTNTTLP